MKKILIADDNKQITTILASYAKKEGLEPIIALDGQEAYDKFIMHEEEICMVLLDVMMPKMDGFEVCKTIRKTSMVPIIMITARGEDYDKIMGLDIGADDYVIKPFSANEVMARVRAILRRIQVLDKAGSAPSDANTLKVDNLFINLNRYEVMIDGEVLPLTKKEIELLWTLAKNDTKVFSRDNLLDSIWGIDYFGDSRTVDSHIKRMRAKLDKYNHEKWDIKTIWGVGYRFEKHL